MDYLEKTDCCGSMLASVSGKTTLNIAGEKLKAIKEYGFDGLVTTCTFCFKVFDSRQKAIQTALGDARAGGSSLLLYALGWRWG